MTHAIIYDATNNSTVVKMSNVKLRQNIRSTYRERISWFTWSIADELIAPKFFEVIKRENL